MADLLFPDNTVLINFALINRMDLLSKVANGRGRWCLTVAGECERSSREPGLGAMATAPEIFGTPLYPENGAERLDVEALRSELAEPGDPPYKHYGEAETLAIMSRRSIAGFFVTDDTGASRLARNHSIAVLSTWDLLRLAVRCKLVDPDTAWGYRQTLMSNRRGTPFGVVDRVSFDAWLG